LFQDIRTPRELELKFREELGSINPQICLIDVAMSFFSSHLDNNKNKSNILRKEVRRHGHSGLYTDHLNFNDSKQVGYIALLALIQSKADSFCTTIQNHKFLNKEFKSEAKGDFLRKTIYMFLKSSYPSISPSNPIKESDFDGILDNNHILLIDYYRNIRNETLHGTEKKENSVLNNSTFGGVNSSPVPLQFRCLATI
jgi:hypothetical protein